MPMLNLTLPVADRDHIQGPADARFKLLEYGDYECPACGQAYPIVRAIQKRLGNQLCFAFRNFPLAIPHPHAMHAAEAAEAAGAQGQFWEMHDLLFENQESLDDKSLARYAVDLGLDADRFMREVVAGEYWPRIHHDFVTGARAGVNGTPTFFVNGVHYHGGRDVEELILALAESAEKTGKS
jgi:protein-disulfide isomerase